MAMMGLFVVAVLADVAPADGVATGNKSDNDNNTANDSLLQAFSLYSLFCSECFRSLCCCCYSPCFYSITPNGQKSQSVDSCQACMCMCSRIEGS